MNVEIPTNLLSKLLPHQMAVVDSYSAQVRHIYLDAPVGAGKTITAIALALNEASRNPNARILVMAPARSLVLQYADRFKAAGMTTKLIDRYAYRGLMDASQLAAIWPEGNAYGITTGLATQPDVASTLIGTTWDLVIADEVRGPDTRSWLLLQRILASARQALIISATEHAQVSVGSNAVIVKWNLNDMVDQAGQSLAPPKPRFDTIDFKADQDLERTASELCSTKSPNLFVDAAASSPAALERAIESYMARGTVEGDEVNAAEDLRESQESQPKSSATLSSAAETLAGLTKDEKAAALVSRLRTILSDVPPPMICVITKFVSTAYYLSAVIEAEEIPGLIATAVAENWRENINSFVHSSHPIVLIATRGAVISESLLRRVTDLIFYEAPEGPQVDRIVGHANAIGRRDELRVYEMRPV